MPVARGRELGTGEEEALDDQGQDQGALAGGLGGEEVLQTELATGRQDCLDVAVGLTGGGAERFVRGEEGFASEGTLDQVNESEREVGQVAEGTMLDLAVVAVRLAEQIAHVSLAMVLTSDLGHVHGSARLPHAEILGNTARRPRHSPKYSWLQMKARNGPKGLIRLG